MAKEDFFIILGLIFLALSPPISITVLQERVETISELVSDIIKSEPGSSTLCAKTCWSKTNDIKFIRSLSIPTQIGRLTTFLDLPTYGNINRQWFFIDMNCEQNFNILSSINDKFFAHPFRWIIVDVPNDSILTLNILPDSNLIIANQDTDTGRYTLKQVYRIAKGDPRIYESFGYWSRDSRLIDLRNNFVISRRRRDLKGHRLIAAAVFMFPGSENYTDLDDYHHIQVDTSSKLCLLITKHWVESVNATLHVDVHRTWGYRDPKTGQFNGMSGQLQRKEADIGGSTIFVTADRVSVMEYLSMELPTTITFVLRSPPISYVSNIYYLPFNGMVWICSISLVVLSVALIASILKFQLKYDEGTENMEISDYILFAIASTCQMGSNVMTNILSARISFLVFYVALLFIYTSFTANIVALLQSTTKSIRTIGDLQNPSIGIGLHDTPYNRHYFKIETEPIRKHFYETKVASNNEVFMNLTHGIDRLRGGMFAFHVEASPGYNEVEATFFENEKCGLVEVRFLGETNAWSVIQKHSPYKEILKVSNMKIREHGIQTRERARVLKEKPKCESDGKNFGSVRLVDCYAALMIFVYGLITAFLIFGVENFIKSQIHELMISRLGILRKD